LNFALGATFPNAAEALDGRQRYSVEFIITIHPIYFVQSSGKTLLIDEWITLYRRRLDIGDSCSK
jgi:hypothetical protein